uniref:Uncharacterized protein n=1 Tax=Anguilla anguilla TaxID=7936 RepID=A0A0E9RRF8_ANGAN
MIVFKTSITFISSCTSSVRYWRGKKCKSSRSMTVGNYI